MLSSLRPRFPSRRRRGLTLVEFMVSITLFGFVGIVASAIVLLVALQVRRSLTNLPSDANNYRLVDRIRQQVLPATAASLVVAGDGRTITFFNPTRDVTSRVTFDPDEGACFFVPDVSNAERRVMWTRALDCQFEAEPGGRRLRVTIETAGRNRANEQITLTYTDLLTIRN